MLCVDLCGGKRGKTTWDEALSIGLAWGAVSKGMFFVNTCNCKLCLCCNSAVCHVLSKLYYFEITPCETAPYASPDKLSAPLAQLLRIGSQMHEVRGSNPRLGGLRVSQLPVYGGIGTLQSRASGLQSPTQGNSGGTPNKNSTTWDEAIGRGPGRRARRAHAA